MPAICSSLKLSPTLLIRVPSCSELTTASLPPATASNSDSSFGLSNMYTESWPPYCMLSAIFSEICLRVTTSGLVPSSMISGDAAAMSRGRECTRDGGTTNASASGKTRTPTMRDRRRRCVFREDFRT